MDFSQIKTLKRKVEYVLISWPETRNSDIELTHRIWKVFHRGDLAQSNGKTLVYLDAMFKLPREDNVKRIRAKFQNEKGLYLPTSWEVAKKRNINELVWHSVMGANSKF